MKSVSLNPAPIARRSVQRAVVTLFLAAAALIVAPVRG